MAKMTILGVAYFRGKPERQLSCVAPMDFRIIFNDHLNLYDTTSSLRMKTRKGIINEKRKIK